MLILLTTATVTVVTMATATAMATTTAMVTARHNKQQRLTVMPQ